MEYRILTTNGKLLPAKFTSIEEAEVFGTNSGFKRFDIVFMMLMKKIGPQSTTLRQCVHIKTVNKV